jgi:hypothetical protein
MLASDDTHQTQAQLLTHWLDERYGWRPDAQTFETFQALLERAGQVLYQAIYVRDHVFSSSQPGTRKLRSGGVEPVRAA